MPLWAGVELTAELNDFIRDDVAKYFPHLVEHIRISLLEATGRILSMLEPAIAQYAHDVLEGTAQSKTTHAKVYLNALVTRIDADNIVYRIANYSPPAAQTAGSEVVTIRDDIVSQVDGIVTMKHGLCVWAGGVAKRPFVRNICDKIESQKNRFGIEVSLTGHICQSIT
jgi:NADH:ubiquinone reductase (non-electrogenic)